MDKQNVVYIHNIVLLSGKEQNYVFAGKWGKLEIILKQNKPV
jgi:hypothetical protein